LLNVVGVKLTPTGRTLACDAGKLALRVGERVVIDDDGAGSAARSLVVAVAPALRGRDAARTARAARGRRARPGAARSRRGAARPRPSPSREREPGPVTSPSKFFRVELARRGARATFYFARPNSASTSATSCGTSPRRSRARVELRQVGVR
jgi:hypothetical protein